MFGGLVVDATVFVVRLVQNMYQTAFGTIMLSAIIIVVIALFLLATALVSFAPSLSQLQAKHFKRSWRKGYNAAKKMHAKGVPLDVIWLGAASSGAYDLGQIRYCEDEQAKSCEAEQHSDAMVCHRCKMSWDMNDPQPPNCHQVV